MRSIVSNSITGMSCLKANQKQKTTKKSTRKTINKPALKRRNYGTSKRKSKLKVISEKNMQAATRMHFKGSVKSEIRQALQQFDAIYDVISTDEEPKLRRSLRIQEGKGNATKVLASPASLIAHIKTSLIKPANNMTVQQAQQNERNNDAKITVAMNELRKQLVLVSGTESLQNALLNCAGLSIACFQLLCNDSLLDISRRMAVYRSLLGLLVQLAQDPYTVQFLTSPLLVEMEEEEAYTCQQLLSSLVIQADVFIKLQKTGNISASSQDSPEMQETASFAQSVKDTESEISTGLKHAAELGLNQSRATQAPTGDSSMEICTEPSGTLSAPNSSAISAEPPYGFNPASSFNSPAESPEKHTESKKPKSFMSLLGKFTGMTASAGDSSSSSSSSSSASSSTATVSASPISVVTPFVAACQAACI